MVTGCTHSTLPRRVKGSSCGSPWPRPSSWLPAYNGGLFLLVKHLWLSRPDSTSRSQVCEKPRAQGRWATVNSIPPAASAASTGPPGTCQCPWRAAQNKGGTPLLLVRDTAAPCSSSSSHTSSLPLPAAAVRARGRSQERGSLLVRGGPKFSRHPPTDRKTAVHPPRRL